MHFIVIAGVGMVFLATASHLLRGRGGAQAERRFWVRLGIVIAVTLCLTVIEFWLVPRQYERISRHAVTVISYCLIWWLFMRGDRRAA